MQFPLLFCKMKTGCEGETGQCCLVISPVISHLSWQKVWMANMSRIDSLLLQVFLHCTVLCPGKEME